MDITNVTDRELDILGSFVRYIPEYINTAYPLGKHTVKFQSWTLMVLYTYCATAKIPKYSELSSCIIIDKFLNYLEQRLISLGQGEQDAETS